MFVKRTGVSYHLMPVLFWHFDQPSYHFQWYTHILVYLLQGCILLHW